MYRSAALRYADREAAAPAPPDWCATRRSIVRVATEEWSDWSPPGNKRKETDPDRLPALARYWQAVPGFQRPDRALAMARLSAAPRSENPWSAAFICYVMRAAGVRASDGFVFGAAHMSYIVGALRNRERSDRTRPFWLYDQLELQHEATPAPGDLICLNRCVKNCGRTDTNPVRTHHTVSSLRWNYWSEGRHTVTPTGSSHCALVVGFREKNGQRYLDTIGGNESNSVMRKQAIPVDQYGTVADPGRHQIFGIIKLIACP